MFYVSDMKKKQKKKKREEEQITAEEEEERQKQKVQKDSQPGRRLTPGVSTVCLLPGPDGSADGG